MKDENYRDHHLSLGLSISNDAMHPYVLMKNRKGADNDLNSCNFVEEFDDGKLIKLLQFRDRMLKVDPMRRGLEDEKGVQLIQLLLLAASAVDANNVNTAIDVLQELYQQVSLCGDPVQRVTAYFTDGLAARIISERSPFCWPFIAQPNAEEKFLAFTEFYQASPYYQFAHFTANQVIIEAFEKEEDRNKRRLCVLDFDVSYGFQWPSMIQSLGDKATASQPVSFRIAGFGEKTDELKETEMRLVSFSKSYCNFEFEFAGLPRGSLTSDLDIKHNTTIVVNLVFYLRTLKSSSELLDTLMTIYALKPSVVIVVEKQYNLIPGGFIDRFVNMLNHFAAMFESLDECFPAENMERLSIEKNQLGREIEHSISSKDIGTDEQHKFEKLDTLKCRMESVGFRQMQFSSRSVSQAKLLLKLQSHFLIAGYGESCGFKIYEEDDGKILSLGWQNRHLITVTSWCCDK